MFKGIIRKADIILLIVLVVVGVTSSVAISASSTVGTKVTVDVDGELYGTYSLYEDRTVEVKNGDNSNIVVIKDGTVTVAEASCHNQVCVDHVAISETGQSIICLPNRVIVKIEGKGDGYDVISS